jgi:hypothetical protein
MERDPASASAEYLAIFRSDISNFIGRDVLEACVSPGVFERAYDQKQMYFAFVDPSGGSNDSMTLAISHGENEIVVLDLVREIMPPFSPESIVKEFSKLCLTYGCDHVIGDRYGDEWPREAFRNNNVEYRVADRSKSERYIDALPFLNSRHVRLLDHKRLISQFASLERRTARGGRDSIDHQQGGRDDVCNSVAGSLVSAIARVEQYVPMAAPYIVSVPSYFPSSNADTRNPAISGGDGMCRPSMSAMERFAAGVALGGYRDIDDWS